MRLTGRAAFGHLLSLLLLLTGLSGCGGTDSLPSGPSVVPPQAVVPRPGIPTWLDGYVLTAVSLSGTVYESTAGGRVPIAGALIYCELCGELTHTWATADANGFYSFSGNLAEGGGIWLSAGTPTPVWVQAPGYHEAGGLFGPKEVLIVGDARLDFELVRR